MTINRIKLNENEEALLELAFNSLFESAIRSRRITSDDELLLAVHAFMTKFSIVNRDELRHKEVTVTLTQQEIIEYAYTVRNLVAPLVETCEKLEFKQANCCQHSFYKVKQLLKMVDEEYLREHQDMASFYNRRVLKHNGMLCLENEVEYLETFDEFDDLPFD